MDCVSSHIEKFNGKNFHLWKLKMQMILDDKDFGVRFLEYYSW